MKKRIVSAVLAAAMIVTLGACGKNESKKETYTIATDTAFAPFEFEQDGEFIGIDVDLMAAIAADQGFTYELQRLGFDAAVQALEAGQADATIAGMSITEEREKKFDFSNAYFDSGVVMGIAADNETVTSYADLSGQKVAVKTGTEGAAFAESIAAEYGFETIYFNDSPTMYDDVKTGNSIACFEDYPVLGFGVKNNNGLKIVTEKEAGNSYGIAVQKGENKELLEMLNKGLENIRANGKYDEILNTYIGE